MNFEHGPSRRLSGFILILGWLLMSSVACRTTQPAELQSFGLPIVSLQIKDDDLAQLKEQAMSKRPVNAEISLASQFKVQCKVSYAGRSSLDAYRKSLQLEFCGETYRKRSRSRLSAQLMDASMLRSSLAREIFRSLDLPVSDLEWVSFYMNREFQGLYLLVENVDDRFFKARKIPTQDIYKAQFGNAAFRKSELAHLSDSFSEESGSDNDTVLRRLYENIWLNSAEQNLEQRVDRYLDRDMFLRYMAGAVFLNHFDGFTNNYYLAFDKERKLLSTIPWDFDRVWEKTSSLKPEGLVTLNQLLQLLLEQPNSRQRFADILRELLKRFPSELLTDRLTQMSATTGQAFQADPVLNRRTQAQRIEELSDNIRQWNRELEVYLEKFVSQKT